MSGVPSYTVEALGHVWDGSNWVKATPAAGGGSGGDASAANQVTGNASLVSIDTKLTAPVQVVGAVSGVVSVDNLPATQPVTGTFWPATQPVSGTVAVSNFPASQAVTGTFFQGTQPVSAANLPLPTGAAAETTLAAVSGKLPATLGQKPMAASLAVVMASDQGAIPTTKQPTGGTNVLKTGTITTSAVTADQVVLTYTVTAAKTFYLTYVLMYGRLTTLAATASILGAISLESPAGTKLLTLDDVNNTTSEIGIHPLVFSEPIPIAAGTVLRVVVTPTVATSMLWRANFGGYEK